MRKLDSITQEMKEIKGEALMENGNCSWSAFYELENLLLDLIGYLEPSNIHKEILDLELKRVTTEVDLEQEFEIKLDAMKGWYGGNLSYYKNQVRQEKLKHKADLKYNRAAIDKKIKELKLLLKK